MKKVLYTLVIIFFTQNCGINQDDQYFSNVTKKYRDFDLLLIIPVNKDNGIVEVCISNTVLFKDVFLLHYNSDFDNFYDFVYSTMNQGKRLEFNLIKDLPHKIINPKAEIFTVYKEKGFKGLVGNYLEKKDERFYSINLINEDDKNGLIKIMFGNHYYISWNDYGANFVFSKELNSEN